MRGFLSRSFKSCVALLLIFCLIGSGVAKDAALTPQIKEKVLASIKTILTDDAFVPNVDFSKWDDYLAKNKKEIDDAKTNAAFAFAVDNAVSKFGVSHIFLMTPEESTTRLDHSIVGIGISFFPQADGILITRTFKGSAAYAANLMPGDLIMKVNGSKKDILNRLRGKKGTTVKVTVKHANGKLQDYTLLRKEFDITVPATLDKVNDTTDILTIPTFDVTYDPTQVAKLLTQAHNSPNLIIDLRSNPGGALLNMINFLSLVLHPETQIGEIVTPDEMKAYQKQNPGPVDIVKVAQSIPPQERLLISSDLDNPPYKGHIAVLINGASGSAAEIAAQALKETRNATIVGEKSAGAVLVSVIYKIPSGFMLECPRYDYVSIGGVRLEGHGVIPDIDAKTPIVPSIAKDPAIQAAAVALKKRAGQNDGVKGIGV